MSIRTEISRTENLMLEDFSFRTEISRTEIIYFFDFCIRTEINRTEKPFFCKKSIGQKYAGQKI